MSTNNVVNSLPSLSGDGLFQVNETITGSGETPPNYFGPYSVQDQESNHAYSNYIVKASNLIGTTLAPYMPVALPAYITTLYQNVYNINTNLQNDISGASINDRKYPTTYAVHQYVQSQLYGSQVIDKSDEISIDIGLANTLIDTNPNLEYYQTTDATNVYAYKINDLSDNEPRIGATKTVVYNGDVSSASPVLLKAGMGGSTDLLSKFSVAGNLLDYYQFTYKGDFVQFILSQDINKNWVWLVTNYHSVFFTEADLKATYPVDTVQ